jgi:methyl-accepting chemotaxis protein/cytochrome b561
LAVALVLTQLRSLEFGQWVLAVHRHTGLIVLILVLARLAIGRKHAVPKEPIGGLPAWQRLAAAGVHRLFLLLLIVQPLIGIFASWARGDAVGLLGMVTVPAPFDASDAVRENLLRVHVVGASLLLSLVVVHIGAIAFNHLVRGVAVIERMLPAAPAQKLINRTPIAVQMSLAFGVLIAVSLITGMYAISKYREVTRLTAAFEAGDLAAADSARAAQVAWKELLGLASAAPAVTPDERLHDLAGTAKSSLDEAATDTKSGDLHDALAALSGKVAAATPGSAWQLTELRGIDVQLQDIVDSQSANAFQRRTENDAHAAHGHDLIVVAMVPTVVIGIFIAVLLSRSINGSLKRMSILVDAVAAEQSDGAMEVIGRGEFSALMRGMLEMRAAVEQRGREMLEMRAAVAQRDAESVAQTHAFEAERVRRAEEQQARDAATERRERMERQQQRARLTAEFQTQVAGIVEAVADTVRDLKATADTMATSAGNTTKCNREASEMARRTSDRASSIAPAAVQLSTAANGVRVHAEHSKAQALRVVEEAAEAKTQIESLVHAARQIGSIADEINDIARRTSLLAINARIQAALAGDAGRGFAVVATEVKELAAKTRGAVDGIGSQIKQVTTVATQSGEFLQRVLTRIESLESAASGICNSADAQCASTSDIAERMTEISVSTQSVAENIDAAQDTASATESMAAAVVQAADLMEERAMQLQDQVANFVLQIQDGGASSADTAVAGSTVAGSTVAGGTVVDGTVVGGSVTRDRSEPLTRAG